jgi:small GTP-binding protein
MGKQISKLSQAICVKNEHYKIIIIGTEGSGKTAIFNRLKSNEFLIRNPTIGFNVDQIRINGKSCTLWDFGGHEKMLNLWEKYLDNTDLVLLVVDSTDKENIFQLEKIYEMLSKNIPNVYLLMIINNIDLNQAIDNEMILKMSNFYKFNFKLANIIGTSAMRGDNLNKLNKCIVKTLDSLKFIK